MRDRRTQHVLFFDGPAMRATLSNPGQDRLYVSFGQNHDQPGRFLNPPQSKRFINQGFTHLHVQSLHNDWFINVDTKPLARALRNLAGGFEYRCAMGLSMGGYGVLRYAKAMSCDAFLVIAPQFSIHPDQVRFEKRFLENAHGFDPELGDLKRFATRCRGAVMVDPFRRHDLHHARMILRHFKDTSLVSLPFSGHNALRCYREGGTYNWLRDQLMTGLRDRDKLSGKFKLARRSSPSYWKELSTQARKLDRRDLSLYAEQEQTSLLARSE